MTQQQNTGWNYSAFETRLIFACARTRELKSKRKPLTKHVFSTPHLVLLEVFQFNLGARVLVNGFFNTG
jgi:hypothetical protein